MIVRSRNVVRIVLATGSLLLLPLLAMQMTDEVAWDAADFAVAGVLLVGTGLMYELAASQTSRTAYRVAFGVALATALILVWMNLAVGLIGSEDNPANLLYLGVLAVGLIGAAIARLGPRGMARALFATALAQASVPLIAMMIWKPPFTAGVLGVLAVNALFVGLWVVSALLFGRASPRRDAQPSA